MEFVAGEVGVRGLVRIVGADTRIREQNRTAAVRLKPVLVWINSHRISSCDCREMARGDTIVRVIGHQREEAAIGTIDVHPSAGGSGHGDDVVEGIDRADPRRSQGDNDGADVMGLQHSGKVIHRHTSGIVDVHVDHLNTEDVAHARVRVVSISADGDDGAGLFLSTYPQSFEISDRATGGQVSEVLIHPKHGGQALHTLFLHRGGGWTPVQGVVVRIDQHRG